ncbi:hypothetical protein V8C42DRAFT_306048 [Trichoderma barbatum]
MRLRGAIPRGTGQALTIQPANQDGESVAFRGVLWPPPVGWTNERIQLAQRRVAMRRRGYKRPVAASGHRVSRRIRDGPR